MDVIIKKGGSFQCSHCGIDLWKTIEDEAKPVYEVFARMGVLGSSVTMDTAKNELIYKTGIICSNCGTELKPCKK
jgi:hypothetical protein